MCSTQIVDARPSQALNWSRNQFNPESSNARWKLKVSITGQGGGGNPVILRGFNSPGNCPQLLKEPDLWQEPMISAVINKTVKLINPSLCSQEKKNPIYYQYRSLLVVDQTLRLKPLPPGQKVITDQWLSLVQLPMFVNKPYCTVLFDDMIRINRALQPNGISNGGRQAYESQRISLRVPRMLFRHPLNYCDQTLDKCCRISLNYLVNGSAYNPGSHVFVFRGRAPQMPRLHFHTISSEASELVSYTQHSFYSI